MKKNFRKRKTGKEKKTRKTDKEKDKNNQTEKEYTVKTKSLLSLSCHIYPEGRSWISGSGNL